MTASQSVTKNIGALWSTSDGGRTWKEYRTVSPMLDVAPLATNAVWAVGGDTQWSSSLSRWLGSNGVVFFSGNGGKTWRKLWSSPTVCPESVSFANASDGWASGLDVQGDGVILATTDGGITWKVVLRNDKLTMNYVY